MTEARPVQQVTNTVKPSPWKPTATPMRHDVVDALDKYCRENGYEKREVVDVALRDHLKLPEPTDE